MAAMSQDTFNKLNHYVGVRLQQGVPLVDADWNEMEDIRKYELHSFLKSFVGSGVPFNNDGFAIAPPTGGETDDFLITGGDGTAEGAGRCLVDGWEVKNESDMLYTQQPLYNNPTLAAEWAVDPLPPLSPPGTGERTDTVYIDSWERALSTAEYQNDLYTQVGQDTCIRLKREWVVRVAEGGSYPPSHPQEGHVYYTLAEITRHAGQNSIADIDIIDRRRTGLSISPETPPYEIPDGGVTEPKLAAAVTTKLNRVMGTDDLQDGAVTELKLDVAVQGKLVTNGNSHTHGTGDGAAINYSDLNMDGGTISASSSIQNVSTPHTYQVNTSMDSTALAGYSQVNASLRSEAAYANSQVNAGCAVKSRAFYTVCGGHGTETTPTTQNIKWELNGQTGDITYTGTLKTTLSDYSEYFENLKKGEISMGVLIALDGAKVRPAKKDEPFIGVVSGTAAIRLGDSPFHWQGRFLKDEWGRPIYEDIKDPHWQPGKGETEKDRPTIRIQKENPDYDPTIESKPRSERPKEWTLVGLLGQVYVRCDGTVAPGDFIKSKGRGIGTKSEQPTSLKAMDVTKPFDGKYSIVYCLLK